MFMLFLCLFACGGVQHILCCVFALFLWIVHFSYYPFGLL